MAGQLRGLASICRTAYAHHADLKEKFIHGGGRSLIRETKRGFPRRVE